MEKYSIYKSCLIYRLVIPIKLIGIDSIIAENAFSSPTLLDVIAYLSLP